MPESNTDQTGSATANQQSRAIEKRTTQLDEDQQAKQDMRLREHSFEATEASNPDRSQDKRKRMDISL
jgi:hypothetical protein